MGRFSCLGIPKRTFEESAHRQRHRTPAQRYTGHRDLDGLAITATLRMSYHRMVHGAHCHSHWHSVLYEISTVISTR